MSNSITSLAISDTGFVFDPRTGHTYAVNSTGLAVLRGLKNGRTLLQIGDELATEFDRAVDIGEHLRQFSQLLVELGLARQSEFS